MPERRLSVLAAVGLVVGAALGLAGSFAPTAALRGLAWGIDGSALVMASAILAVLCIRKGQDLAAAGFLVFAIGEGVILSIAGAELSAGAASFGAGAALWAVGLALVCASGVFPLPVRLLGAAGAALFAVTAGRIFLGSGLTALSRPLPFFAYPLLVATLVGWAWAVVKRGVGGAA